MSKLAKAIKLLEKLEKNSYTGSVTINFSQGGVTKVNKNESVNL